MEGPFWKGVALFMVYLTVSLIFVSALALRADAVLQVQVTGQDQVPSFRRTNDTTSITVFADSNLVTLLSGAGGLNLSCTNATNGYLCTYTFPEAYQSPGRYSLTLQQSAGTPPTTTTSYVVDGTPPAFSRAEITQLGGSVSAAYTIRDTASATTSDCSGLAMVKLIVNDNVVASDALSGCDASGVLTGAAPGIDGQAKIYLLAMDALGNAGTSAVVTRAIDTVPPILPTTFQLLRNGADVMQLSTDAAAVQRADLVFTVTESALKSVTVDASGLTQEPALQAAYKTLTPACTGDETKTCIVRDLQLDPASGDLSITVTARDASGNSASGQAVKTLAIENTKPTIAYLGRADLRCDTCYLGSGTNILLAEVDAPGGLRGGGLFLTTPDGTLAAQNCTNTQGSSWSCTFAYAVTGTSGQKTISVSPASMDDLGNAFSPLSKTFKLDTKRSQVIGAPKADALCPAAGQTLTVTATVKDTSPSLRIWANVSDVTDRENTTGTCTPGDDGFLCTLTIDSFVSVHTKGEVPITVTDEAGNTAQMLLKLEVCEAEPDATPNYITGIDPSGPLPIVDKRLASLIPFRVNVPLKLTFKGNAKVTQVRRVTCDNPFMLRNQAYMLNEFSQYPVLAAYYQYDGAWPNGTVPLNCTVDFTIRRGNTIYLKPESENLSFSLPVARQELGNPGDAIREKENNLVADINKLQDRIKSKAAIDNSLGKVCKMAEMLGEANAALQAVKAVLYSIAVALVGTGIGSAAGIALWAKANLVLSSFHNFVNTYIWPVGWISGGGVAKGGVGAVGAAQAFGAGKAKLSVQAIGYMVKWTCGLYECKMYDAGEWAKLGLETKTVQNFLDKQTNKWTGDEKAWQSAFGKDELHVTSKGGFSLFRPSGTSDEYYLFDPGSGSYIFDLVSFTARGAVLPFMYGRGDGSSLGQTAPDQLQYQTNSYVDAVSSITGDNWIVNPYRSTRYDGMCIPAQLYNARKEKQLKCIELKCIREAAEKGMPITQCEEQFSAQSCLYLESAQARTHGSIGNILLGAVAQIALQMVLGYLVQRAFKTGCQPLYSIFEIDLQGTATAGAASQASPDISCNVKGEPGVHLWSNILCGSRAVACGLIGAAFNFQELAGFADSLRAENPTVPTGQDFCEGLDGVEPDDTVSDGGGFI